MDNNINNSFDAIYSMLKAFKRKYPLSIGWRLSSHTKVVEKHLNPGETVSYAFFAQRGLNPFDIFSTFVCVLTNKRILLAQKRVLFGYTFLAITPDMFNDLTVDTGIFWGEINIDTVKETVVLNHVAASSVSEIETQITEYMMEEKKKYSINIEKDK